MDDRARDKQCGVQATEAGGDTLILVDEADREIGHLGKDQCHAGRGILHRAFSVLIFNPEGELLLQQRAPGKRLWPLFWSNSCCSHPRAGETLEAATARRLEEELGFVCPLRFLFKFQYQAQFDPAGAENELCSVYIGMTSQAPCVNESEIHAWRWISPEALDREMAGPQGAHFTPWFLSEWELIRREHRAAVAGLMPLPA
jgi:isopentenyl-diphosphate delta-isomerase